MADKTSMADLPESVQVRVAAFLADHPTDAGDALWIAAAGLLELVVTRARDAMHGRLRSHPAGELRRLEDLVERALVAARLGVELHQAEQDDWHAATRMLRERAAASAKAARRRQTLPAEQARLAKQRAASDPAARVSDTHR